MLTSQDCHAQHAWRQRERREGIVLKRVKLETPVASTASFVSQIEAAITPRTKVIEVMHISFQTGYIAPVREIVELARPRGIKVFVDGAHAFAHFPFTRDELGCDFYGTRLHKWLHAPIGTGFLYVRRDKVKSLWPLMAGGVEQEDNIRKYGEIGRTPPPTTMPSPSPFTGRSARSGRSHACDSSAIAGRVRCSRRATVRT